MPLLVLHEKLTLEEFKLILLSLGDKVIDIGYEIDREVKAKELRIVLKQACQSEFEYEFFPCTFWSRIFFGQDSHIVFITRRR